MNIYNNASSADAVWQVQGKDSMFSEINPAELSPSENNFDFFSRSQPHLRAVTLGLQTVAVAGGGVPAADVSLRVPGERPFPILRQCQRRDRPVVA